MTYQRWQRQGTATLTNGSATVIGQLTAWAADVRPGDAITVDGTRWVEIQVVTSNTALTLAEPWGGATSTAGPYRIDRRSVLRQMASDTGARLTAFLDALKLLPQPTGGDARKLLRVDATGAGFQLYGGMPDLAGGTDAGKGVRVNSGGTAFELGTPSHTHTAAQVTDLTAAVDARIAATVDITAKADRVTSSVAGRLVRLTGTGGEQGQTSGLFENASGNVGIGTTSISARLHIAGGNQWQDNFAAISSIRLRRAEGTQGAPAAQTAAATIGQLEFWGYDGTAYRNTASILAQSAGAVTATSSPGRLEFRTAPVGSVTPVVRGRMTEDGRFGWGLTNPSEMMSVAGVIQSTIGGFKFPDGTVQATAFARVVSANLTPPVNGTVTFTHGLGAAPGEFGAHAVCLVANNGYAVGELVALTDVFWNGNGAVSADATVVTLIARQSGGWPVTAKTSSASFNLSSPNWAVRLWARL